jgi:hypothetical protein
MGSTNFLIWDQAQTNMEDDAEYLADSQRIDGGENGVPFPSSTFNKFGLQASGMAYAIAEFLASKGATVLDSNISGIVSSLQSLFANVPGRASLQNVGYSPSISLNASQYLGFQITLAGAVTLSIAGESVGDQIAFIFVQNSAGGNSVAWPSNFYGFPQPDQAASSVSVIIAKVAIDGSFRASTPMISNNGVFFSGNANLPGNLTVGGGATIGGNTAIGGDATVDELLTAGELTLVGGAPLGQALVGNGTVFVPYSPSQTDKTGIYESGVEYTNGPYPAFEQVTLTATGSGTGDEFQLEAVVNGATPMKSWITNDGRGSCFLSFLVPPGGTFTVTASQVSGGSQPFGISSWLEVK